MDPLAAPCRDTGEIAPKVQHEEAMRQVVEAAGHSRPSIANTHLSTHRVQQEEAPGVTLVQVRDAIVMFNGNKKAAANFLRISRQSVYRMLERSPECDK
ncbi:MULTISPECIES: hypothetical protein [Caballeronia]|uniref:hypothetical protein n=1 Tax=Caballeronia TaxID=1827195 RepID=UPI001EF6FFA1|nr:MULTISPECIES: hypothetical protein [Caballeronia]MCG7402247.1 hypothetical protein [Caballeronia zhejiangensis]